MDDILTAAQTQNPPPPPVEPPPLPPVAPSSDNLVVPEPPAPAEPQVSEPPVPPPPNQEKPKKKLNPAVAVTVAILLLVALPLAGWAVTHSTQILSFADGSAYEPGIGAIDTTNNTYQSNSTSNRNGQAVSNNAAANQAAVQNNTAVPTPGGSSSTPTGAPCKLQVNGTCVTASGGTCGAGSVADASGNSYCASAAIIATTPIYCTPPKSGNEEGQSPTTGTCDSICGSGKYSINIVSGQGTCNVITPTPIPTLPPYVCDAYSNMNSPLCKSCTGTLSESAGYVYCSGVPAITITPGATITPIPTLPPFVCMSPGGTDNCATSCKGGTIIDNGFGSNKSCSGMPAPTTAPTLSPLQQCMANGLTAAVCNGGGGCSGYASPGCSCKTGAWDCTGVTPAPLPPITGPAKGCSGYAPDCGEDAGAICSATGGWSCEPLSAILPADSCSGYAPDCGEYGQAVCSATGGWSCYVMPNVTPPAGSCIGNRGQLGCSCNVSTGDASGGCSSGLGCSAPNGTTGFCAQTGGQTPCYRTICPVGYSCNGSGSGAYCTSNSPTGSGGGGGGGGNNSTPAPQCISIVAYDSSGNALNSTQLAALQPGQTITLAYAPGGAATQVRFQVNSEGWNQTTTKNANGQFTWPYTIENMSSFSIQAQWFDGTNWNN